MTELERLRIDARVAREGKQYPTALLLALFLGPLGAHRFYLGRRGSAAMMLMLAVTVVGLAVTLVWTLWDLVRLPRMVLDENRALRARLRDEHAARQEAQGLAAE
ncbi:NINE protein [Limimaricola pyoseonensis]|uniref:TM2 domain-containing protein n=1 Tax=Limimaricola pyoseonensis TaxID=521013 RepID=A0A1G7JWE9_9RHOB|nr:NINE protein [Limimaricola pyoseonensis]SDF29263.1 TM2 domain-containing protein [Limimaricola pyoseonensis]